MKKYFSLFIVSALSALFLHMPSYAEMSPKMTPCETAWFQGAGFNSLCFDEYNIQGLVEIIYLDSDEAPNSWAAFIRFHQLMPDGSVEIVAQGPLTTSRLGRFPRSHGDLDIARYGDGDSNYIAFAMQPLDEVVMTNGRTFSDPDAYVAIHGLRGDGNDNPSTYTGDLEGYIPPPNPNGLGSEACNRVPNFLKFGKYIFEVQQKGGKVKWLIRRGEVGSP